MNERTKLADPQLAQSPIWCELTETLLAAWPVQRWSNVGVVVGCSGGADSVALVRLMHHILQSGQDIDSGFLVVAHFDHQLRGHESDADRDFVVDLARRLGIESRVGTGDRSRCDEAHLRSERYAFLIDTAATTGCRYIALAHSMDDNVETVLHHLMRGTGPAGLAGIAPMRPASTGPPGEDFVVARPMLDVRRDRIREALREIGQSWREDSSNTNLDYQRNWIRGELLPMMASRFPEVVPAIGRAIDSQRDWRQVIDTAADQWIAQHVTHSPITMVRRTDHDTSITIAALQTLWQTNGWSRTAMTKRHWQQIATTLKTHTPVRYTLPCQIDVNATAQNVIITNPNSSAQGHQR